MNALTQDLIDQIIEMTISQCPGVLTLDQQEYLADSLRKAYEAGTDA